jgi:hypothetical protein
MDSRIISGEGKIRKDANPSSASAAVAEFMTRRSSGIWGRNRIGNNAHKSCDVILEKEGKGKAPGHDEEKGRSADVVGGETREDSNAQNGIYNGSLTTILALQWLQLFY